MNTSIRHRRSRGAALPLLALLALLVFPAFASAAAPTITQTLSPTSITESSATVRAKMDGGGLATSCKVEFGTSPNYGTSVPCSLQNFKGPLSVNIAALRSLSTNFEYHYRWVLRNADGTTVSPDQTVTTAAPADWPTVNEIHVEDITRTSAVVKANLSSLFGTATCTVGWGLKPEQLNDAVSCDPQVIDGTVNVTARLTNLQPDTLYHYGMLLIRIEEAGFDWSGFQNFTTLP